MGFNPRIQLGILLLLLLSLYTSANNTTVYEILTKYSLPKGLLPDSVKSYSLSKDGNFEVELEKPCYVEFEYLVYYAEKITGKLSIGSITDLEGIQVKRFFLWLNVNEIRVDLPSSGSIYFQVGIINKKLDMNQFETVHSCRDNALALCGGSLRQVLQFFSLYVGRRRRKKSITLVFYVSWILQKCRRTLVEGFDTCAVASFGSSYIAVSGPCR